VFGVGVGVFGLGFRAHPPTPQSPIPNPQSPISIHLKYIIKLLINKKILLLNYFKKIFILKSYN